MELQAAFRPAGVTAVVGAGGKKSTLYALASVLGRAVVTATVRIPLFDDRVKRLIVTDDPVSAVRTNDRWPLGVVPGRDGDRDRDRYLGYEPGTIDELASDVGAPILIKADGARTRWLKAPNDEEPQLPRSTDLVVPVASARIVGHRLDSGHVHRPERVSSIVDLSADDRIGPEDVATVLAHDRGGLKDVPNGARVVPLINMVDDQKLETTAREIAEGILTSHRIDRVVLGRMDRGQVIDVVG